MRVQNVVCDSCGIDSPALPVQSAKCWAEVSVSINRVKGGFDLHKFDVCPACLSDRPIGPLITKSRGP